MFIPTGTDAPLYHWPIMTAVTMALNVVMFALQLLIPEFSELLWLEFGSFRPHTWLTSAYLHGGFGHLFNNLSFLFIFGLIVEGKIGWWRFALVYNISAIVASIIINIVAMWAVGAGLGASCAIFAMMAICFLWAPENQIQFHYVWIFLLRVFAGSLWVSVQNVCFLFIAFNFLTAAFTGFGLSSALFHLIGLVPGIAIGVAMIRLRQVNCEGYDLVSIVLGKRGQQQLTTAEEAEQEHAKEQLKAQRKQELQAGLKMIDRYIADGHFETAYKRFQSLQHSRPNLTLPETPLLKIINGLENDDPSDSLYRRLLRYYLKHYDRLTVAVRLKLARRQLQHEQPRQALKVLAELSGQALTDTQHQNTQKLTTLAKRQIAQGVIEVQTDD